MKSMVGLLLVVCLSACEGGSFVWGVNTGGFVYEQNSFFGTDWEGLLCKDDEGWWVFAASLQIQVEVMLPDAVNLVFCGKEGMETQGWSIAQEGDIVSYDTMRNKDGNHYIMRTGHLDGRDDVYSSELTVNGDTSLYLAFVCADGWERYVYGWVEISVSGSGNIEVLGSAYDYACGPMVVGGGAWTGGIPEPSGGMLFLLGAAVLGLRRRTIRTSRPIAQAVSA